MKHLFISASVALILMSCGQAKQEKTSEELKEPINPRDTSTRIVCDSINEQSFDANGNEVVERKFVCDSHYVSGAAGEEYLRQLELYEKAKVKK
jgi:mannitol-specific phosphotransferase system IIBC component